MDVLLAGCGWLGRQVAARLLARGDRVTGLTRTPESAAKLRADGFDAHAVDLAAPASLRAIPGRFDGIVAMQSAAGRDVADYRRAYLDATRGLLESGLATDCAFVYVSSTGVFGQDDGSWVDEKTEPKALGETSEILIEAERLVLRGSARGASARVVRCSGLYGPGRTATIERVRTGALSLGDGDSTWMNFIHRDDAADTVIAALDRGRHGAIYHASDAAPATRREVAQWIAERLGMTLSTRESGGEPATWRGAHRRVSSEATRSELGLRLAYPSFREGLAPFLA
jgi:nucleoside-diphosphate-sugar epimerase